MGRAGKARHDRMTHNGFRARQRQGRRVAAVNPGADWAHQVMAT
jgi:hypothetical protein